MTNPSSIAAEAAPRARPAPRFITLVSVAVIGALLGACATKTNTGATVAEKSFGAGVGTKAASGESSAADGSQAGAAGGAGEGRSAGGAAGAQAGIEGSGAEGDSSRFSDSADAEDDADDFTAGEDSAGADGAGSEAGGGRSAGRSSSGAPGSSEASRGDDGSGSTATGAGGRARAGDGRGGAGSNAATGGARAAGAGRDAADGAAGAGADYTSDGDSTSGAGGRRAGQSQTGADGAVGAGSDQESMVVGMVDAPGSRVRIEEDVTPQTLGGMLPLAVGVDEEGHFDFDQAVLRPEVKSVLDELAARLRDADWDRLDVMGYTDRIGADDYNQHLSERRAWAVARYLVAQGIPVSKMKVEGRGERSSQVAMGDCHDLDRAALIACLQKDRRVEIEASIRKTEAKIH